MSVAGAWSSSGSAFLVHVHPACRTNVVLRPDMQHEYSLCTLRAPWPGQRIWDTGVFPDCLGGGKTMGCDVDVVLLPNLHLNLCRQRRC